MKQFLGVFDGDAGDKVVTLGNEPLGQLEQLGGRSSPVWKLGDQSTPLVLPAGECWILFLFPASPRAAVSVIENDLGPSFLDHTFVTHGLAAIVCVLSDHEMVERLKVAVSAECYVVEEWAIADQKLSNARSIRGAGLRPLELPSVVDGDDLPYEASLEVRQFNENLRFFWMRANQFCPEYADLVAWLADAVAGICDDIRAAMTGSGGAIGTSHDGVTMLIDINACLTILNSQVVTVLSPILEGIYPIGEYSLLGIGSMARAAWRIYSHISTIFASADSVERLKQSFPYAGFDPGVHPYAIDWESWDSAELPQVSPVIELSSGAGKARRHIVYFSSRWGFHETRHSISVSWQCLNGAASRELNFLTLSHEFLHSHYRELIMGTILTQKTEDELNSLVDLYNSRSPHNRLESMQMYLIQALRAAEYADDLAAQYRAGAPVLEILMSDRITADELRFLLRKYMAFIDEVIVHVLDYVYFYDTQDGVYVSSLWHSWGLVPAVARQIPTYVLRTIFALSYVYADGSATAAFNNSVERLRSQFDSILAGGLNPLISEARLVLSDNDTMRELLARFRCSYALVKFAQKFLIDPRVRASLVKDSLTVPGDSEVYRLASGDFPGEMIESPVGFLLDRYPHLQRIGHDADIEFDTLWQFLVLVEGAPDDADG